MPVSGGIAAAKTTPGLDITQLDPEQEQAVHAPRGPVCVLAGAGTGKTRTITQRIAHLIKAGHVSPNQVLAVTFTQRAAGEMRDRLRQLGVGGVGARAAGVQSMTFHASAMRQLRYFWPLAIGGTSWELLDNKFPLVGRAARDCNVGSATETVRDLLNEIEWAKATLISPEGYTSHVDSVGRTPPIAAEQVAAVFERYEELKTTPAGDRLLDFDDLLMYTASILETNAQLAEEFRSRYRSFVVDEYQDVTPLQQRLLDVWLGDRDDITVVGDANQTIYSFAGAKPDYLLNFTRKYPEATLVRLQRDYRSTPQVVTLANAVISAARGRVAGTRLELIGQRPSGPAPIYAEHDDEPAEAASTADRITKLIAQGVPPSEIAILYRINAHSEAHENALTNAGIPYQVRGGEAFFDRIEVRQAMRALRNAAQRDDLPAEADVVTVVKAILVPLGLTEKQPDGAKARERWEALRALMNLTAELIASDPHTTLYDVVRELDSRAQARQTPTVDGVTLSSLHAAKGLEWDAVFLVGATEGAMPIAQAIAGDADDIEEERRLFYVGVTRAREHLTISWALARQPGGRKGRKRTRFLDGIAPASAPHPKDSWSSRSSRTVATCRICGERLTNREDIVVGRCAACPSDRNDALFAALKVWRKEEAFERKIPAFAVFSDATLVAIAEREPEDRQQLLAINGIGSKKYEQFGSSVLQLVHQHRADNTGTASQGRR